MKRSFKWMLAAGLALSSAVGLFAHRETRRLVIERPQITIQAGVRRPVKLRILHLCDMHLRGPAPILKPMIEQIERLEYDLALVGGDLADNEAGREYALLVLKHLRAPLGNFAVPGNHDLRTYSLADMIRSTINELLGGPISQGRDFTFERFAPQIEQAGVRLLRNESMPIELPEGIIWLCGMNDEHSGNHDLAATLRDVPAGALHILFTHSPDPFPEVAKAGVPLMLAGHTHGGQVIFPLNMMGKL